MKLYSFILGYLIIPAIAVCASYTVVTTSSTIHEWVEHLNDNKLSAVALNHSTGTTLSPAHLKTLKKADLILANGTRWEPWLVTAYAQSGSQAKLVCLGDKLPLVSECASCSCSGKQKGNEGSTQDKAATSSKPSSEIAISDSAIWLDPDNAILLVNAICNELILLSPEHAKTFSASRDQHLADLKALDTWDDNQNPNDIAAQAIAALEQRYGTIEGAKSLMQDSQIEADQTGHDVEVLTGSIRADIDTFPGAIDVIGFSNEG